MDQDDSSELSSLSSLSPVQSDNEPDVEVKREPGGILKFFHPAKKEESPLQAAPKLRVKRAQHKAESSEPEKQSPPLETISQSLRERVASPPREPSFSDNPDIAFIVMFRSRFNNAFPKSLQNFGPQELEKDVKEEIPGTRVENFLCAILGLLLNRKQDVKPGHYSRALEDAISSHKSQWPSSWKGKNPIPGQATFTSLAPFQRLNLLRTLILWSLGSSDTIRGLISTSYKQNRHNDDLNQPLSVQPWGIDSLKRRYYLIEGLDDTAFRVYREGNPQALWEREWISIAGSIPELRALAEKLDKLDGGPRAKKLSIKMMQAVPRFEATEEKRRRREYRLAQKDRFKRPEPGFSLYEGRTRGKRIKYTFSDDEADFESESITARRSVRNTGTNTPVEPAGPVTTLSGRQVRRPRGMDGSSRAASVLSDRTQDTEGRENRAVGPNGRPRRSGAAQMLDVGIKRVDFSEPDCDDEEKEDMVEDDEDEHVPEEESEDDEEYAVDEDEEMVDDDLDDSMQKSLVVKLPMPMRGPPPSIHEDEMEEKIDTEPTHHGATQSGASKALVAGA